MTISVTNIGSVNNASVANGSSVTIAFPAGGVPAGATIVVVMLVYPTPTVTDGANTYTAEAVSSAGATETVSIYAATNVTARTSAESISIKNGAGFAIPIVAQAFYLTSSGNNQILADTATAKESNTDQAGSSVSLASGTPGHAPECFIGGTNLETSGKTISYGSGWTQIGSTLTTTGFNGMELGAAYNIESSATTLSNSTSASESWLLAIVGFYESVSGVTGTWASTENKDSMSVTGGLVGGTFTPTEHTDTMSATGEPGPRGTWASTEATDTFSARGGLVSGTWASTEAKDTMAAAGYPELSGTWASTEAKDRISAFGMVVDDVSITMTLFAPTMHATATEEFVAAIHMMLPGFNQTMDVTEIIPTRIGMTLPLFSQVFEAEEVPAHFFTTGQIVTNLIGFSRSNPVPEEVTVTVTPPIEFDINQAAGRGGGGIPPKDAPTFGEEMKLFRGAAYRRGMDAGIPPDVIARQNLTTPMFTHSRPVTVPAPQGKPKQ